MILDLDGATAEPTRRKHVVALSAAAATVSLLLLFALLAPAPRADRPPPAAAPLSTSSVVTVTIVASGGYDQVSQPTNIFTSTGCAAGVGSSPPVHVVFDRSGRVIAAYSSGRAGRFVALPSEYVASGWLTVPCDTSDVFAPRINRAR